MKIYLILLLIFFVPILSFGQTTFVDSSQYSLGFKLGYFYPTKSSFQDFYSQSLGDFPLSSMTVELEYIYQKEINLFAEMKIIQNKLEKYHDRRLFIIPAFIGIKYQPETSERSNYFMGIAPGFYWMQMVFAQVLEIDDNNNLIKRHDTFYKSYFGTGIKFLMGIDFKVSDVSKIGIQLDYDISYFGNVDKGSLGNTGGLLTNIFFNFEL